ncbi:MULTISPECIES: hypothetical protein [unclassified Breznakia]|uniref:hypothetical protein n=1 Tax=unclassified Breznakia TaxID=2623764 RepID=UPI002476CBFC|nr:MULTISPECIES: hypothetical protein [unclassified Breznakia]MDH6368151.1 hypothetical protein [Breznakia sp. PH1-1]MDH6405240.1 hypothetical protein [Breznakia sp. PF1-11]MDH6412954.1 hypothetical protein [Breznakia sp. PFB1-11]MDH6415316.1 hypothetical protein [Breznakia sp. PFB1-14]MDH6416965.1 hypothetical protein [Breznakia sp. PFB1-4]
MNKRMTIVLIISMVVIGCTKSLTTLEQIEDQISNLCEDRFCNFDNFVEISDIKGVGIYTLAKVNFENRDGLVYGWHDELTREDDFDVYSAGLIRNEDYHVFENLDESYGRGHNYYICMTLLPVNSIEYNGKKIDLKTTKFDLNGETKTVTTFVIELDSEELLNKNLLDLVQGEEG